MCKQINVNLTMQIPCKVICVHVPDVVRLEGLAAPWAGSRGGLEKKEKQKQIKENKIARTVGFFLFVSLLRGCPKAVDGVFSQIRQRSSRL